MLHYRNLIRFFSGNTTRADEISMKNPEGICKKLSSDRAAWYRAQAEPLDNPKDKTCDYRVISQYLQHCTTIRSDFKEWRLTNLYKKLEPLLQAFEHECLELSPTITSYTDAANSTMTVRPILSLPLADRRRDRS